MTFSRGYGKKSSSSFFKLPSDLRAKIYVQADLITDCDINFSNQAKHYYPNYPRGFGLSLGNLLLICHSIHEEVIRLFYSRNRFFLRYQERQTLHPLQSLSKAAIAALTHLTVHLNAASCHAGGPCTNIHGVEWAATQGHDKSLVLSSSQDRMKLECWQAAANHIFSQAKPNNLRLYFVCDVADINVAAGKQAVEPFRKAPTLADCAIRLGHRPNAALQKIAHETTLRATARHTSHLGSPFRFLDLPFELRRHILSFTDLITPLSEVYWNPSKGYHLQYVQWRCSGDSMFEQCPSHMHDGCQFRNCWQYANIGCFCRRYHSAYWAKCQCWAPPKTLFLVCQRMKKEAEAVFFENNQFVVMPDGDPHTVAYSTPARLEASIFLENIVGKAGALRNLRDLGVVFPIFEEDYLRTDEPGYQAWLNTISHIKNKLNLPLLTIRVFFAQWIETTGNEGRLTNSSLSTREYGCSVVRAYGRILKPFSALIGLHQFFVDLAPPFDRTRPGQVTATKEPERVRFHTDQLEKKVETMVMGIGYDSVGKSNQRASQWLERYRTIASGYL